MIKAYAYLRVSGKGQIRGFGFQRQEEEILRYAKSNKIEVAGIFKEEGVSGAKDETERPAFQEMISAILKNGVKTIIIEGLDRLAREMVIQEQLIIYLASKNIELISARTGENVTSAVLADPLKKAMIQMQGIFAELEKNQLVKKLKAAREHKKLETGKCEGRKGLTETKEGLELIKAVKRLRRKPKNGKALSYAKIAEKLNADGIKTITGKLWTDAGVQKLIQRH
jgi:DNA invertase Pin-like site-specific DNA recombinase